MRQTVTSSRPGRGVPVLAAVFLIAALSSSSTPVASSDGAVSSAGDAAGTSWKAVLVEEGEPGQPLVVSGTIYAGDGTTPLPGVRLHVYNTDANGLYAREGDTEEHRIKASLVTGPDGRYEFRTIKPGSYPGGGVPAHIHYVLSGDFGKKRETLHFQDDPNISAREKEESKALGRFGNVQSLNTDADGVLRVVFDIKVNR